MTARNNAVQFLNYPRPREGPPVPYENETQSIPVFRGVPLAIGASIIQSVGFVQSYLWRNAGFSVVHQVPQLNQYTPRFDPTVTPIDNDHTSPRQAFPAPTEKRKGDYGFYTSADYRTRYLSGELTPTAVVEALLPLISRDTQPPGKHSVAFLESQEEIIRSAAAESTQRYKKDVSLGPLDGVPVAVKDEVHVKGYKRTLASKMDFKGGCDETSWCVRKWEEAGAIVIGKTSMHELGLDTNNNNPIYGTPRNPHNPNYYCGGSSGGSGYAVASGLTPIALGADGGGSIRIPSSFCGIWGLKPSHNRVSGAPSPSIAASVGVLGPMASSIDDLALSYRTMAAPAPADEDPASALFPDASSTTIPSSSIPRPRSKTIGIVRDWVDRADPSVRAVFDKTLEYYRTQKSYKVIDISIPCLPEGQRAHVLTIMAEIADSVRPDQICNLTPPNKVLVSMGTYQIKARDLLAAQRVRDILMSHLADLYTKHPGLLIFTPTSPVAGWKIGSDADLSHGLSDGKLSVRNMEYVYLANFTGCPAISSPAGYDEESHVPIGVMAMGEWGAEEDLIAFARDGEGVLDSEQPVDPASGSSATTTKGLRAPSSAEGSVWVNVVAEATKKDVSSAE